MPPSALSVVTCRIEPAPNENKSMRDRQTPQTRRIYSFKGFRHFVVICVVVLKHLLWDLAGRWRPRSGSKDTGGAGRELLFKGGFPGPRRLRLMLENLGTSFIKLGQLLSTRPDMLPNAYIEELKNLQDKAPPVPFDDIRRVIETETGQKLEVLFSDFEPECLAAASVAQVHRARYANAHTVAVKVIRPGIHIRIQQDIRVMYAIATLIEKYVPVGAILGAINLVAEFERTIYKELDMFIEAGNIEKFAGNFKGSRELHIPQVHWNITTRSVLVMEYIEGVRMDEVARIRALGIDPREISMIGLRSFSRQLMEFGFFHADPHPGNAIVMPDGRVSLIDFGIMGFLDEDMMHQVANVFLGYAEHDYDMILEAFLQAGLIDEALFESREFRTDLKDLSEPFYGRSLQTIEVRDVYEQVMRVVIKYRIKLPRNFLLLFKTLIQTEALGKLLDSDASLLEVTRPYAQKLIARGYDARKLYKNLGRDLNRMGGQLKLMPKYIHDILRQTAKGQQRLELWHGGFEEMAQKVEKGVNRLTVGIIIAASTMAAALVLNSSQKVLEFSFNFMGPQTFSLTGILGIMGYSIATILGIWLILAILRSGKM